MTQKENNTSLYFYQFLGAHSLLIGLLPFFLPVYLWTHGLNLAGLCLLVGISGLTFAASLSLWQHLSSRWPLRRLVTFTFVLELALVFAVGIVTTIPGMPLFNDIAGPATHSKAAILLAAIIIGVFNGLYNAFFWTTQRTLFLQGLGNDDAGRQYGNFQIFVTLFLKAGILLGGLLLDLGGFVGLLAISAGVSAVSNIWLAKFSRASKKLYNSTPKINTAHSLKFSDHKGSQGVFMIDGVFLYLESHFWTLSLFLLVEQDFTTLGVTVVFLAAGFALSFYFIKNRIDQLPVARVYRGAVALYVLSWLLRFTLTPESNGTGLVLTLLFVTFCSSFFRLAFNKRFFDIARSDGAVKYLLIKSYSSQLILGVLFTLFAMGLLASNVKTETMLQHSYLAAAILSLGYLFYKDRASTDT